MTRIHETDCLGDLVTAARAGDVAAYGRLVQVTQAMSLAVAVSVLRDPRAPKTRFRKPTCAPTGGSETWRNRPPSRAGCVGS